LEVRVLVELFGRLILIVAIAVSFVIGWWCPLVVAPVLWQIWDRATRAATLSWNPEAQGMNRTLADAMEMVADGITFLLWVAYVGYAIFSMGRHIGGWLGWVIGVLVGLGVAQLLGLFWPFRWALKGGRRQP
jgi:hypothetical protein